ncbi:NADPH:quinone reductase [Actinophytocola xanthii]|uniref:NADPH:quinone reductase n=2 Tax=Actinophytocola xanthii TaxID=1912961 RepID=A0A1Q8CGG4_9PSEU|nr:NADP-dependent oxidoreductase [Actinophytocola xanthii]OLF13448.1 NADPH:quinone reductase [Actinophytocola xanthii]
MRAIVQDGPGGPEALYETTIDRPVPLPTEVLVRVHATSVNPVDWKTRAGSGMAARFDDGGPFVLGWDVSGVVEEVGFGVTRFREGDEVYGMPRFPHPARTYAGFVTAPSRHLARRPAGLDHAHAAAVPLVGLTAWQALVETADLREGQRVLVHAAAGGVGHVAVQLAKARGAHVIGTASTGKHEFLRELGADELIDYRTTDFAETVRDVDVVLDLVGGDYSTRSIPTLRPGGLLLTIPSGAAEAATRAAAEAGVSATGLLVEPDRAGLEELTALIEAGRLRVEVETVLPLESAAEAHRLGEAGRTRGKIVLAVDH